MTVWSETLDRITTFRRDIRAQPVMRPTDARALRSEIERRFDFTKPIPLADVARAVADLFEAHNVLVTHPRYFGLFNPTVREAAVVADTLVAAYNPQIAAWSHGPAAAELERRTLHALAAAIGYPTETLLAHFTSGGMEANLTAVLGAIAHRFPETSEDGVGVLPARGIRPAIYITSESHHSFVKIARMTGLGTRAIREVPLDRRCAMDPEALAHAIATDVNDGWAPLLVCATFGTTASGICDDLTRVGTVARDAGAWFHVDAAWGAAAGLVPRFKPLLAGVERADSLTWDAHKWLSVPMGAGMFFSQRPDALQHAFAIAATYMPPPVDGATPVADAFNTSVQWSRRSIGTKLFVALAELGLDGYARLIDHQIRMGDALRDRLRAAGWIIVNETPLPLLNFTAPEIRDGRVSTGAILQSIYARGQTWISEVVVGGRERALRACITSYDTREEDLDVLVMELEVARSAALGSAQQATITGLAGAPS
jgi:glutamate/tyrosine decarboxylase-like PLP-dependent enzyme